MSAKTRVEYSIAGYLNEIQKTSRDRQDSDGRNIKRLEENKEKIKGMLTDPVVSSWVYVWRQ